MNITNIEARDLPEAFFRCCRAVLLDGYEYTIDAGSYEGTKRKELDFLALNIKHPGNRPLAPDVPPGVPPPTNNTYLEEYLSYLMTDEVKAGEQYTYGYYLARQIEEVIKRYKVTGPNNNQLCMNVGDRDSIDLSDPPCMRLVDTRIRYGKLHFVIYFRSWDLWAGFPTNLGGLQLVKEYMAEQIGVEDGEMICLSKGLHLYDYAWEFARLASGLA
jgi:thymidylate synthase